ncbi:MAG: hypothetical protein J6T87_00375 [Bacteroidales bacterium]|nr:hypothetical protein [Bacteroidales bacterium]
MAKKLSSNSRKHKNAVVVCSIIGRKGFTVTSYYNENIRDKKDFMRFHKLLSFLSKRPYEESSEEKIIYEQISEEDFKRLKELIDSFPENNNRNPLNNWLPIFNKENIYYCHQYPLLGEYLPDEKKIILYIKNIEKFIKDGTDVKKSELFNTVHLHEMFHAYFHYVTEQKKSSYNYILEIEEAMTEFCSLVCLQDMSATDSMWKDDFDYAYENIKEKQNEVGNLAAYGFGAYLFEKLKEKEQYELINNYIQKLGYIDKDDNKVKEYCEKVRLSYFVPGNQKHCLNLLKEILEPTAN